MRRRRRICLTISLCAFLCASLFAQNKDWSTPYEAGVKAFDKKNWAVAIDKIEQAIKIAPKQESSKLVEGVIREDYFPYYYLAMAYSKQGDLDRAEENAHKATDPAFGKLSTAKAGEFAKFEADLQTARRAAAPSKPPSAAPPPAASPPKPSPAASEPKPDAASARTGAPVSGAPASADNRKKSDAAFKLGMQAAAKQDFATADRQYQSAIDLDPENTDAKNALEHSQGYENLREKARSYEHDKRLDLALRILANARAYDEERFLHDELDKFVEVINGEKAALEKRSAPAAVPVPFAGTSEAPVPPSASRTPPTREALLAYLGGDVNRMIALLAPAANDGSFDNHARAEMHAYLGVGYASRSLTAVKDDERKDFSDKANAEFRLALSAQPGYQLSERLVSPKIQSMLEAVRTRRQ